MNARVKRAHQLVRFHAKCGAVASARSLESVEGLSNSIERGLRIALRIPQVGKVLALDSLIDIAMRPQVMFPAGRRGSRHLKQ